MSKKACQVQGTAIFTLGNIALHSARATPSHPAFACTPVNSSRLARMELHQPYSATLYVIEKTTLLPCLKQVMLLADQAKEKAWC